MELTPTQKQALYEQGYVALPGIVPQELVEKALHAINASLGSEGMDPQRLPILRAQTYCPEITASPEITGLLTESPLWSLSESVIGQGSIRPVKSGQIALRFPAPGPARPPRPHLDGMYSPNNGVKEGVIDNFTALIGVFLSAIPHDFMGNLAVWPGTHRLYEDYFRKHTPQSLLKGLPEVNLPEPQQITAQPGDAVLCHYQLGHGITINTSPYIRYAIFFRLRHVNHEQWQWECMTNIWREWAGMHDFANSRVG
ncbi:hypothetical protein KSC_012310 [Ktedonobacter sp. SOSP1-52]|uniref:hypothetical protein n=1 Tax=Ktedonobacter sp. SOSP1-52 TaxID=2778366 RepID=UPI00191556EE|nr:hypothetical protein [Ktedonobacter sp. SOSP1-52]GHO62339.1 hypothetical protein KSC_012310 [Ktedonobacter sp. SOSP1-52]